MMERVHRVQMMRTAYALVILSCMAGLLAMTTACISPRSGATSVSGPPRFFVEALEHEVRPGITPIIQLPDSHSQIAIKPVPVIPEFDIASVQIVEGVSENVLAFALTREAQWNLMRISDTYRGRRLVLVIGAEPAGYLTLVQRFEDGVVFVSIDAEPSQLRNLLRSINHALHHAP